MDADRDWWVDEVDVDPESEFEWAYVWTGNLHLADPGWRYDDGGDDASGDDASGDDAGGERDRRAAGRRLESVAGLYSGSVFSV